MVGAPVAALVEGISITTAGGAHGIVGATDLLVTQNGGGNMSVNVAAGRAIIRSTEAASLLGGAYSFLNDGTVNLVIAAADPTNPRIDLVIAQVRDSNYSGASTDARLTVVTGTPAGAPVTPAVPDSCVVLAQVAVAAGVATILTANITDKRTRAYALGGVAACLSTTRPSGASLYDGLPIYETDTQESLVYYATPAQWRRPWRMPWGFLATGSGAGDLTTAAAAALTIITTSGFALVGNRRVRVSLNFSGFGSVANDTFEIKIFSAGGGTLIHRQNIQIGTAGNYTPAPITIVAIDTPVAAGSTTYLAQIIRTAGTGTFTFKATATFTNALTVEDMGPNGAPA